MAFIDNYNFENLMNESEKIILDELGRQLESYGDNVCHCEDCVLDMAAIAMNTVKPLYRVSLLGSIYVSHAMEDEDFARSVQDAVREAIEKVRENPSH